MDIDDIGGSYILYVVFEEFDSENFMIYFDGVEVVIEFNGLLNYIFFYWLNINECIINGLMGVYIIFVVVVDYFLFVDLMVIFFNQMVFGNIDDFNGFYILCVLINFELVVNFFVIGLGVIGIVISGLMIYNDQEGFNVFLDDVVVLLDYNGVYIGFQSYYYYLEFKVWMDDDGNLIGIMFDGFFLYGCRDYDGSYLIDLDVFGGYFGLIFYNFDGEYYYYV